MMNAESTTCMVTSATDDPMPVEVGSSIPALSDCKRDRDKRREALRAQEDQVGEAPLEKAVLGVGKSNAARLMFAKNASPDQPFGTASIFACLALVLGLVTRKTREELLAFLGFDQDPDANLAEFLTLTDPCRVLNVLLSEPATTALDHPTTASLPDLLTKMGASTIPLAVGQPLENQINGLVKTAFQTDKDMFEPFSIVPEESLKDLIAALVSIEKIVVSWDSFLDKHVPGTFTRYDGTKVSAVYCEDDEPREMPYLTFGEADKRCQAVLLKCKTDEATGKTRGMVFVLPDDPATPLDNALDAIVERIRAEGSFRFPSNKTKVQFKFPKFDAHLRPLASSRSSRSMYPTFSKPPDA